MEKVVSELKEIKDSLFNSFFENNDAHNGDAFKKLLVLKNLDDNLKETLVLLHSNYIAELETIKKFNYKALDQILANNLDAYNHIVAKDNHLASLVENLDKNKPKLSTTRVVTFAIMMLSVSGFLGFMWYLFSVDKEAGIMIIDLVKVIFDKVGSINLNPFS